MNESFKKESETEAAVQAPHSGVFKSTCFWLGLGLFLLAFLIRFAYIIEYEDRVAINYHTFDQTDNHTFHLWARNIAGGDWLCRNQIHPYHRWTEEVAPEAQWIEWYGKKEIFHQAPLYPYVIASLYYIFGEDVFFARLFQTLMGACTCLLVFLTGRLLFGRWTGLAAGLLIALSGYHLYYDAFILREGLIAFLTIAFLYLAAKAFKQKNRALFFWAGLVLGLGIAAKPTAMVLIPVYLIAFIVAFKEDPLARRGARAFVFFFAMLIPLAPLYVRNVALGCPMTKISTRGPTAFINGNLREQTGSMWTPPAAETRSILREADYELPAVIKETLKTYIDYPPAYVDKLWRKTAAFLNSYEIPNNTNFYLIKTISDTLDYALVSYHFLVPCAILGMLILLPRLRQTWQLYAIGLMLSLATIAFFIVARFRQPVVPILAIFAGYSLIWFLKKVRGRRWLPLVPALAVFAIILSWTGHSNPTYSNDLSAYAGAMKKLIAQQEFARAEHFKNKLFEANRAEYGAHYMPLRDARLKRINEAFREFNLGSLYGRQEADRYLHFARGYYLLMEATKRIEFEEYARYTTEAAEKALALDPNIPGAHKTLGLCLAEQAIRGKDYERMYQLLARASSHIRAELENNPDDLECIRGLGTLLYTFGDVIPAINLYTEYLRKSQDWDVEVAYLIARIMASQPELPPAMMVRAAAMAEDLYRHDPRDVRFNEVYADMLEMSGRLEEARAILEKMITLDPDEAEGYRERIENLGSPKTDDDASEPAGKEKKTGIEPP
ncbi:MAG: glycosyltransferase family 39 protein [Planctomycetota bacterium]|jgi:4-amino-4-deoxy-L-arabinose transferase-like glycosyltransferase